MDIQNHLHARCTICGHEAEELAAALITEAAQTRPESLDLSDLQLTSLPMALGGLGFLKKLVLNGNLLRHLPPQVLQLRRLEELSIEGNELEELPPLTPLKRLKVLELDGNVLARLPRELRDLKHLTTLSVHDNPDLRLPSELFSKSADEILDLYFRILDEPRELREVKVLFLGRGAVGKTSLTRRLRHKTFNKNEDTTHGIRILPVKLPLIPRGKRQAIGKVTAHIWDFGGQEIMHATHQFFLSRRSVYVLVLTGRAGRADEDAEYWMRLIGSLGADSPVIVVRNKIDSEYFELDETALRLAHPSIVDFVATDAATGHGIADLRSKLIKAIGAAPGVRQLFPRKWFRIKEALREEVLHEAGRSWIRFPEFRQLCVKHGESNELAQERLASWLHDLGIALNYREDQRLNETSVLDPLWVTRGIYAMLTSTSLAKAGGVLRMRNVPNLLRECDIKLRNYPRDLQRFLVALMRKFELCYELPGSRSGADLVPELLPAKQPAAVALFSHDSNSTALRYRYHVLPEGLVPRFITRMHPFLQRGAYWRRGAILRFEGARALVIGNDFDRMVTIRVNGTRKARYKLLAMIRSDFGLMHDQLSGVKPVEETEVTNASGLWMTVGELETFEREGTKRVPRAHTGNSVKVAVVPQLNALAPATARQREKKVSEGLTIVPPRGWQAHGPLRLFISYAHVDEKIRKKDVTAVFRVLENERLVTVWDDRMLIPGDEWDTEIREKVRTADLVVFLVTREFIISNYIRSVEAAIALQRAREGRARIVAIVLRRCSWQNQPWARYHILPIMTETRQAVQDWRPQSHAWDEVERQLRRLAQRLVAVRYRPRAGPQR